MRVAIAGFDRGFHSSTFPAVADAVRWLRNKNYIVMDIKTRDDDLGYPEDGTVSNGCRNMAIMSDVLELYSSDALFMLPSWEGIPEAQAMYAVAKAMKKPVIDFPHTAFMET